ncbi:hypothetical protein [Pseudomonas sp. St316]|uniref:hypothetical protein n=1 Tax=Pseudomonas sp. St316 TaxID=2678257 RepID=UPI001BB31902|nr:hypothetical protein [Pseudomonas sp. St316]
MKTQEPLWEPSLLAMRRHIQHRCKQPLRYREQAQLPQGSAVCMRFVAAKKSMWELSLLAMAVYQFLVMLDVPAYSRASSLPAFFQVVHRHRTHPQSLWEKHPPGEARWY